MTAKRIAQARLFHDIDLAIEQAFELVFYVHQIIKRGMGIGQELDEHVNIAVRPKPVA